MSGSPFDQTEYIERLNEHYARRDTAPLAFVATYGCQQNVSDSEKIKGFLEKIGFSFTNETAEADLILINTCAVREHAELKIYGNVGALKPVKARKKDLVIALCGCMMQQESVQNYVKKKFPHVDMVFGPSLLAEFPKMLYKVIFEREKIFSRHEISEIVEDLPVRRDDQGKAWVTVMYGCNNFCTYCIVPYVRGRERSRKSEDIIREVRSLVENGYKDITLLGQNVNSYGKDLKEGVDFSDLLYRLNEIPGEFWLRFTTSHPKDCTRKLIDAMRDCGKVCKHLHLPFQSGSSEILRRMNRHYTREDYLSLVAYAKEQIPDLALTSDVIVGFPGETEKQFEETISLIREVEFDNLFTFIYSKRNGTKAAEYPDQIPREIQQKRFERLLEAQTPICKKKNAVYDGKTVKVFAEQISKTDASKVSGHTETGKKVDFTADESVIGNIVDVEITKAKTWFLEGKIKQ